MGFGFGVWGLGFEFGVWRLGFGVWSLGFGVWGLGFGVWDIPREWIIHGSLRSLHMSNNEGYADKFVRELTFAKQVYRHSM